MVTEIKNKDLYYVGGVVRDEILGVQSFDTDFCYEGNAIEFVKREGFQILRENSDFGTVKVIIDGKEVDIASTRAEYYPKKGHLPFVNKVGCSLKEDLVRRDFTINAMAKNTVTSELVDYFGGLDDLRNKKLRVLHENSFIDDPTRIIRALKFSVRFGFELDDSTKKLQDEYLSDINNDICYHRIKKELKETFNLNSLLAYKKFVTLGIYKLLGKNQKIRDLNPNIECLVKEFNPAHIWLVYLGNLDLTNLELTKQEQEIINSYNSIGKILPINDVDIYYLFKNIPLESILLYAVNVNAEIALKYLRKLMLIKPEINGNDLKVLGYSQGKIYKEIFDYLLEQKILGKVNSKEDEINIIRDKFRCG